MLVVRDQRTMLVWSAQLLRLALARKGPWLIDSVEAGVCRGLNTKSL